MSQSPPITDSPWFWLLMFAGVALGALAAMGPKYGQRQATIERQYQARERTAALRAAQEGDQASDEEAFQAEGQEQGEGQDSIDGQEQIGGQDRVDARGGAGAARREFATPEDTLVPLWPLAALLGLLIALSVVMLVRSRLRLAATMPAGSQKDNEAPSR